MKFTRGSRPRVFVGGKSRIDLGPVVLVKFLARQRQQFTLFQSDMRLGGVNVEPRRSFKFSKASFARGLVATQGGPQAPCTLRALGMVGLELVQQLCGRWKFGISYQFNSNTYNEYVG